jgi:hypothetical protein
MNARMPGDVRVAALRRLSSYEHGGKPAGPEILKTLNHESSQVFPVADEKLNSKKQNVKVI